MKILNTFFLWAFVEGHESVGPGSSSPAPAPAPSGNSDIAKMMASKCRKPDDGMLNYAANTLADACNTSSGFSPLKQLAQRVMSQISFVSGALHCMATDKPDSDVVTIMIGRSGDICNKSTVGVGRVGRFICVISADLRGRSPQPYVPAPKPKAPDAPKPSQPAPEPQKPSYPTTPSPPSGGGDYGGGFDERCFQATNSYRSSKGLPTLRHSGKADSVCRFQSECMARKGTMSHTACGSFRQRLAQGGASNMVAAENIAGMRDSESADSVVKRWIESPGHDRNIRKPDITTMSCCAASNRGRFSTQVFLGEGGY